MIQSLPVDARRLMYGGGIFRTGPSPESLALTNRTMEILRGELGPDPRVAQFRLPAEDLQRRLRSVRRTLASDASIAMGVRNLMRAAGFEPAAHAIDHPRLRAVLHDGHRIASAAPAYLAHRDTWYANPSAQINWWLALHDASEEECFQIFPDEFERAVPNDSDRFRYEEFRVNAGWQNALSKGDAVYPSATAAVVSAPLRFSCRAGEVLLFSAAHLHQTRPSASGRTRFSLDFRTVHLGDHEARDGAPDVDNRSQGSSLVDYPDLRL
jgi:ectoine hydroxylase-related dioxygenase (phytanoyl-CoA dioxygenase family)